MRCGIGGAAKICEKKRPNWIFRSENGPDFAPSKRAPLYLPTLRVVTDSGPGFRVQNGGRKFLVFLRFLAAPGGFFGTPWGH